MISSSENLYDLIINSKVEILSVIQKYNSMPEEMHLISTYNFTDNLKYLIKSGVFNNVEWRFEQKSEAILLLTSNELDNLCGTYLEVEITPFDNVTMHQIIDTLKETIFAKQYRK